MKKILKPKNMQSIIPVINVKTGSLVSFKSSYTAILNYYEI